jgi:hypothetical protein
LERGAGSRSYTLHVTAPVGTTANCLLCRRTGPVRQVAFRQNVGVILLRFAKKVEGRLCRRCMESTFGEMTLTTFFAGWWGIISFFVTPFILLSNILEYSNAIRSPEMRSVPSSGKGRQAILAMAGATALVMVMGFSLVAALALFLRATPSRPRQADGGGGAGAGPLHEAEEKILGYQGRAAHGNTPEAERDAAALSEKMELVRKIAFTGGRDEKAPSLTEGHFLTYCEVRQGKVCFLVHVPELRGYTSGARETLGKTTWALAQQTVESHPDAATLALGVGLRGVLLYGIVMTGTAEGPTPPLVDDATPLERFFTGPLAHPSIEETPRLPEPTPPVAEPTPALPLAERLKRDIESIGLAEFEPRQAAIKDLESLGLAAVPALLKTAQDPTKGVTARATSMHLLGMSGSPEAVPVLLRYLEDQRLGYPAGVSLRSVKDAERTVLPLLARGIERRCVRPVESETPAGVYCWNALNTLGASKTAAAFATPVVLKVLAAQPPGLGLHTTAITAAGNIGPAAKDAVPFMIAGLGHSDSYAKQESIRVLGGIGPAAAAAVPALEVLRRTDPENNHIQEIDKALANIRGAAPGGP